MRYQNWVGMMFLVLSAIAPGVLADADTGDCATLDTCLDLLARPESAQRKSWETNIQENEEKLAKKIQSYGKPAIPRLLELLKNPDNEVRERAGYTLRDIDGLTPDDLPALMAAADAGNGWVPAAIGKIGTSQATAFLLKEVRANPQEAQDSQISWGLQRMRPRPLADLLGELRCKQDCSEAYLDAIAHILDGMDEGARPAAEELARMAADGTLSMASRRASLFALRDMKDPPASISPMIGGIAAKVPELRDDAIAVLVQTRSKEAAPYLLANLTEVDGWSRASVLFDVAQLGHAAMDSGAQVLPYLDDADWDVRVEAAATLGFIGYAPAIPALMRSARAPDWRLSYEAVLSLGMLKAEQARPLLQDLEAHHWSKAVREEAQRALTSIETGKPMEQGDRRSLLPAEDLVVYSAGLSAQRDVGYCSSGRVGWQGKEVSIEGLPVWPVASQGVPDGIPGLKYTAAMKVDDGWLLGLDAGEFGGGLNHYDRAGNKTEILGSLDENIRGLYQLDGALLAVGGLAHLTLDHGRVYSLTKSSDGTWHAVPLAQLPSAPGAVGVLDSTHLVVNTQGGAVAVAVDGSMSALDCLP